MKNLAIIPARGGSKRIPRKNIKNFLGKPIIAYSIEVAIKSELFDEVMVSTDDREIAQIALQFGARVPFYRNVESADDYATTAEVLLEVIDKFSEKDIKYDCICNIYPTAPLLNVKRIQQAFTTLLEYGLDSVIPVVPYSYPIQRALRIKENRVSMMLPENLNVRSQDLPMTYHDVGQFYWIRVDKFLEKRTILTNNSGVIILNPIEVQDIDNIDDWEIAELKYKKQHISNR